MRGGCRPGRASAQSHAITRTRRSTWSVRALATSGTRPPSEDFSANSTYAGMVAGGRDVGGTKRRAEVFENKARVVLAPVGDRFPQMIVPFGLRVRISLRQKADSPLLAFVACDICGRGR